MGLKIDINKLRLMPEGVNFGFCVYGEPSLEIKKWSQSWGFRIEKSNSGYYNILVPINFDISECFIEPKKIDYVDGFSPNLNKHLHIGHMSNFIIAKAFQSIGIGERYISILGDTLKGDVEKEEALKMYNMYCDIFGLNISKIFFASKVEYYGDKLKDGSLDYKGTKIFDLGDKKIVGIKSDGSTSYFYQDVCLAENLGGSILYLTGNEQNNHFNSLKKMYPETQHIGLGLVRLKEKMCSRKGNVIYFEELLKKCLSLFNNDLELSYNVLAGFILKIEPKKDKIIKEDYLENPKNSPGLYLSYTLARLTSAGVKGYKVDDKFNSTYLQFKYMKAVYNMQPNILFNALVEHCKNINNLYSKHKIEGNPENEVMFSNLKEDLELGMKRLGLFLVDKV